MGIWGGAVVAMGLAVAGAAGTPSALGAERIPVWIDTDPAVGIPGRDVDDGMALVQALHSDRLDVRGISTVYGNAPLDYADREAREIVARHGERAGRAAPLVFRGAAGPEELGRETAATRALANALERAPLTVILLGPATNLATVLEARPELAARVERVVLFSGRRLGQRYPMKAFGTYSFENPDPNFSRDVRAVQILLASPVPVVIVPLEASAGQLIREEDLERLESDLTSRSGARGAWLLGPMRVWLEIWKRALGMEGFIPYDPFLVAYVEQPERFGCEELPVGIVAEEAREGSVALALRVAPRLRTRRRALYCFHAEPGVRRSILEALAR